MYMSLPKIVDFKPAGCNVLVEMINPEELINKTIEIIGDKSGFVKGAPQAFVLAVGPSVKLEDWGFKVGDRVCLDGGRITPLPHVALNGRDSRESLDAHGEPKRSRSLVMPQSVVCVLEVE